MHTAAKVLLIIGTIVTVIGIVGFALGAGQIDDLEDSWNTFEYENATNGTIMIEDLDGNSYLTRLMRSGETFVVPDKKGLTLSTGNAGVLSLTFGSTHISKLGSVGEVISSRPLNIEAFKKR